MNGVKPEAAGASGPTTLCEAFHRTAERHADLVALKHFGDERVYRWSEYAQRVRELAEGLHCLGVRRGHTVAIMLTNRPEFNMVDTAAMMLGATPFSVYNTNPAETVAFQLNNADTEVCVCEASTFPVIAEAARLYGKVTDIVVVDALDGPAPVVDGVSVHTADEIRARRDLDFDYEGTWRAVTGDDVLTIIFTSGTTGNPKGVELTHHNLLSSIAFLDAIGGADETDRGVSYLPDAHIVNRFVTHYAQMLFGAPGTSVREQSDVLAALVQTRPTVFVGVPRLWAKVSVALTERLRAEPSVVRRTLANWALASGRRHVEAATTDSRLSLARRLEHAVAERLVLRRIREQIGLDACRMAVSGAAPLPEETQRFVLALGIPLCSGWGMSEATTGLTLQRPGHPRIGTVGKAIDGVELALAEDGELLARGEMIMRGYRKEPEKTAETIDADGWLHTGDLGEIADDGEVRLIGRKKEIIINAAGKNMAPAKIESAVASNVPLAAFAMVIGEARQFNTMLIGLDQDVARDRATALGADPGDVAALAVHPGIREEIQRGIDAANLMLARTEQIKYFEVVPEYWEPGGPFITPTQKLRRPVVEKSYSDLVEQMYRNAADRRAAGTRQ